MTHTGLFINSVDSVELFPRPPRKHCIPVMKKRTPSVGWSPILSGDFPPAVSSSLLLPSDSWNKLIWEANQRTFLGQPASPWKSCLWLLLRPQTQVGECLRWCPQYTFFIGACYMWSLGFVFGSFDLRRTMGFCLRRMRHFSRNVSQEGAGKYWWQLISIQEKEIVPGKHTPAINDFWSF